MRSTERALLSRRCDNGQARFMVRVFRIKSGDQNRAIEKFPHRLGKDSPQRHGEHRLRPDFGLLILAPSKAPASLADPFRVSAHLPNLQESLCSLCLRFNFFLARILQGVRLSGPHGRRQSPIRVRQPELGRCKPKSRAVFPVAWFHEPVGG